MPLARFLDIMPYVVIIQAASPVWFIMMVCRSSCFFIYHERLLKGEIADLSASGSILFILPRGSPVSWACVAD
jgi:hypothetical protein